MYMNFDLGVLLFFLWQVSMMVPRCARGPLNGVRKVAQRPVYWYEMKVSILFTLVDFSGPRISMGHLQAQRPDPAVTRSYHAKRFLGRKLLHVKIWQSAAPINILLCSENQPAPLRERQRPLQRPLLDMHRSPGWLTNIQGKLATEARVAAILVSI